MCQYSRVTRRHCKRPAIDMETVRHTNLFFVIPFSLLIKENNQKIQCAVPISIGKQLYMTVYPFKLLSIF